MSVQQVRVQVNGTWYTLTYNALTDTYEKTITAPTITSYNLPGKYYPVTVEATDSHGNVTTDTTAQLTVKEVTAPTIEVTSPTTGALLSDNMIPIQYRLRDETNGSGVNLDALTLSIDDLQLTSTSEGMVCSAVTGGYDCVYTPQTAYSDGGHTITIDVQDFDGNTSQSVTTITIDTTPPSLNILQPPTDVKTNQEDIIIKGVTNDATSGVVSVSITNNGVDQGDIAIDADGVFEQTVQIDVGENVIVIKSIDKVDKYTEVTRLVDVNRIAPVITGIAATPNPVNTSELVTISVTVTDE